MQKNCSDLRFRQSGRIAFAIVDFYLFLNAAGFESLKKYVMKSQSIEKGEEGKKRTLQKWHDSLQNLFAFFD